MEYQSVRLTPALLLFFLFPVQALEAAPQADPQEQAADPSALDGKVVDVRGVGIAGAEVLWEGQLVPDSYHYADFEPHHRIHTGPDGTFRFKALDPDAGSELTISAPGFVTRTFAIGKLGMRRHPTEFRLETAGSAILRALDEEGRPLPAAYATTVTEGATEVLAHVLVRSREEAEHFAAAADPEGRIELLDLPPGPVTVVVQAPRRQAILSSATLVAGRAFDLGDVVLPAAPRLQGRVLEPSGRKLAGASVRLRPWLGHLKGRHYRPDIKLKTDAEGVFESWPGFPEGMTFEILANEKEHGELEARLLLREVPETPVELSLRAGRLVSGKVVDKKSGKPVAGCLVRTRTTGPEGDFDFEAAPHGAFELSLSCTAPMFAFTVGEAAALPLLVEVEAWPALRGRVVGANGGPPGYSQVSLGGASEMTQADGSFVLSPFPPDGKEVAVWGPAGRFVADLSRSKNEAGELEIRVPASGYLPFEGTVVDSDGQPVRAMLLLLHGKNVIGQTHSGANSTFSFGKTQDAVYSLRVSAKGQVFDFPAFRLSERSGPVEIRLPRGSRLEGKVNGRSRRDAGRLFAIAWRELKLENTPFTLGDPTTEGFESVFAEISPEGTFYFEGLADGDWNIRTGVFGRQKHSDTRITIRSGETPEIQPIELPKED